MCVFLWHVSYISIISVLFANWRDCFNLDSTQWSLKPTTTASNQYKLDLFFPCKILQQRRNGIAIRGTILTGHSLKNRSDTVSADGRKQNGSPCQRAGLLQLLQVQHSLLLAEPLTPSVAPGKLSKAGAWMWMPEHLCS